MPGPAVRPRVPAALRDASRFLACPHCREPLTPAADGLDCARGHHHDVARHGYVSLLRGGGAATTGDTPEMVAARVRFLQRGHFAPVTEALVRAADEADPSGPCRTVVDLGAGPGHHLAAVVDADAHRIGIALDRSKHAMRRAARSHPRVAAVVCDVWGTLPLQTDAVDLVLAVFAPRRIAEVARVLRPGGAFVLVTPTTHHLAELVEPLGLLRVEPGKRARLEQATRGRLRLEDRSSVQATLRLGRDDLDALVRMGPSAWHVDTEDVQQRLPGRDTTLDATCAVEVARYRVP